MIHSQPQNDSATFVPDLTPLLDIIFIVMVFLLLTANIHIQTLEVAIPQTEESAVLSPADEEMIAITVLAGDASWALQGTPYADWTRFTAAFMESRQSQPDKPVVIAADKQASVENMLKVLAFLQSNNINATNIVMEEE